MVYFLGRHLKKEKLIGHQLAVVFGIGKKRAGKLCKAIGLSVHSKVLGLDDTQVLKLSRLIMNNYIVDSDLKKVITGNIQHLKKISCYRGIRHTQGLPCRGQRTHTNARTSRKRKFK
uniref:Small ribosomal subunit protein uS13m n=1 Tax=Ophirina amphinema TaxID=2108040 RepID=A0A348AYR9_9EUKA|nr:ribosomal protein S13 [Ophirina amphinema]